MTTKLDLDDIQSGVLRPRPSPFAATYIILRIDDRDVGRQLMGRLATIVASAGDPSSPTRDTWVSASISFEGLKALGVPQKSLDSFPPQFQQGMAARAASLGDIGENSPDHWEKPLGTKDVQFVSVIRGSLPPRPHSICRSTPRPNPTDRAASGC